MQVGGACDNSTPSRAHQKTLLDEKRLDDVFERAPVLADSRRKTVDSDRAAIETLNDGHQQLAVEGIETEWIDLRAVQGCIGQPLVDRAVRLHLCVVANPAQ